MDHIHWKTGTMIGMSMDLSKGPGCLTISFVKVVVLRILADFTNGTNRANTLCAYLTPMARESIFLSYSRKSDLQNTE